MLSIPEDIKKTKRMEEFEKETGKQAIWKGKITETFKKWDRGEKIYETDQERIGILVPTGTKSEWQEAADSKGFPTVSKLIREAVQNYIDDSPVDLSTKDLVEYSQTLKQALTPIKLNAQFIIEYHEKMNTDNILDKIELILNQSNQIEDQLNHFIKGEEQKQRKYDVLIVEDDSPTLTLIMDFFEMKGYTVRGVNTGKRALEEIEDSVPKLILLDIILPDIDGYEVCKRIREDDKYNDVDIFYITAKSEREVSEKKDETGATGYLLKPFDLSKVEILEEYLNR